MTRKRKQYIAIYGSELSDRERQAVRHIAAGLSMRETANLLGIKIKTVHTYIERVRSRSGCTTLIQIGAWAQKKGLLRGLSKIEEIRDANACNCGSMRCNGLRCDSLRHGSAA